MSLADALTHLIKEDHSHLLFERIRREWVFGQVLMSQIGHEDKGRVLSELNSMITRATQKDQSWIELVIEILNGDRELPLILKYYQEAWEDSLYYLAYGSGKIERQLPKSLYEESVKVAQLIVKQLEGVKV